MTRFTLSNASLVDAAGEVASGTLHIDDSHIGPPDPASASDTIIDLAGAIVAPGFIDVHTHGGGGFNLHTSAADEIAAYARWAPSTGVTAFLAGVVGVPDGLPYAQIRASVAAAEQAPPGAEMLGIHMEGPYINPVRRGAHATTWLRLPAAAETTAILELSRGYLKLLTIAPELPGAAEMIRQLLAAGVTVSLGHSDADHEQAQVAFGLGIRHVTHCFNAMRPLLHRAPGPLGALAEATQVRGELIADGVHVHPAAVRALVGILSPARVVLVTDALPGAGRPEMVFTFGDQPAEVRDGAARLADGSLTGSILTMDQALRNIGSFAGVTLPQALGMLTGNPARSAGVAQRKGWLRAGYDADLVILDAELRVQATICRGRLAFATPDWQARLQSLPPA